jgi:predicted PhzF superfamily epimerase YddE/YHI9
MKHPLYQVDAFTDTIFGGNPACVVPLENWLPDNLLLKKRKKMQLQQQPFL